MKSLVDDMDIVVIGSGVAGALVAKVLAQAKFKVCILEAGPSWTREDAFENYKHSTNRTLSSPFPKADWLLSPSQNQYFSQQGNAEYQPHFIHGVGGTTWNWTAITPRFLPADFALKTHYGVAIDWPLTYTDIEPYYVQAEYALGISGDSENVHGSPRSKPYPMSAIPMSYADQVIAKKLKKKGLKVASFPAARNSHSYDGRPACKGNNMCSPLCPIGASYSANVDVQKAMKAGARLITEAVVFQLDVDGERQITAVHYKHPDHSVHVIKGKRFIIACNAIETARLLLMSKHEQCPNGVANASDQVGRHLMDHHILTWKFDMPEPMFLGRGPQSISTILHGRDGAFRKDYAAVKFFLGNDLNIQQESSQLLADDKNWSSILDKLKDKAMFQAQIGFEVEQLPDAKNRVRVEGKRLDPLGLPLPYVDYKLHPYTAKGSKIWRRHTEKLIEFLGGTITHSAMALSSHHPSGTTRMGLKEQSSVVDKNCQSHEHQNLYMIGSSVFPTQGTANPTLTIAALSLRLADYIKAAAGRK
ncbi:MAG: GMC family oxidoreductase [Alcanivoracaceae bacterium]|nr:GMC family oxidoreductase [Alcanivoracaceae bacterium]